MLKKIRNILIVIVLFGVLTAGIDYIRMCAGKNPIFSISSYKSKERMQFYRGMFYQGSRNYTISPDEPLEDSKNVTFRILFWKIDVQKKHDEKKDEYTIETEESSECTTSKLIYADMHIKVYTYCLDDVSINTSGKKISLFDFLSTNPNSIEDIDYHMGYVGLYDDNKTIMLKSRDDGFTNNGLSMFRCNNTNVNDIYIGPINMSFQPDFCTHKDDDFKFLYKIEEISIDEDISSQDNLNTSEESNKEVFFEDDNYRYEFDEVKSNRIFIVYPSVRGINEFKFSLKDALTNNIITIDDLKEKGLKFNKIEKNS